MPPRSTRSRAAAAAPHAAAAPPPRSKPVEEEKHADEERLLPLAPPPAAASAAAGADSDPDADPCAICLEDLNAAASDAESAAPIATLDRCVHRFHTSCISDWAKVTNLCPLCKTRFKAIREIAHPLAAPAPRARAGLRDRAGKVVRVATKNQCVTFSSEDEEEEEEESAPRARRARRAAAEAEEHTEEEAEEDAPPRARRGRAAPTRRAAPAAAAPAVRSTRNRRRGAAAAAADDETENDGEEYRPEGSEAEADAKPDFSQMTDEEALAWALKESMVISTADAEAANPSRPARAAAVRRPRRAPAAAAAAVSAESKEADEGDDAPAVPKPRGRRRAVGHDLAECKDEIEATSDEVASIKAPAASSSSVEWIRTRDGDWARARTTGVTADSIMAQLRAQMAPAAAAASASSAASAASASASSSSAAAAAASIPKSRTALSQASDALDSFEQRILQRKQMQLQQQSEVSSAMSMPRLFSSAVIDLSAAIPVAAPTLAAQSSSSTPAPISAAAPVPALLQSSSISALSPPSPPSQIYAPRMRLSTTCDPSRASGGLALIDAPGGLRIWKRRESGFPGVAQESNEEQEQQEQLPSQEDQSSQESSQDFASDSGMSDDENEAEDENAPSVPSLWSRVTGYFVQALTPSKAPEAFAAPGGPCMEGQKQPIIQSNRQPLAARRLN